MIKIFLTIALVNLMFLGLKAQNPDSIESMPEIFLCIADTSCKCIATKDCLCQDSCFAIPNKFNDLFAKNCYFRNSKMGRAITPKYLTIYDRRDETVTYLKLKNAKGYEYFKTKKHIQPKANFEMHISVIAQDTGYHLKTTSEDLFMEYEESFAQSIQKASSTGDTSKYAKKTGDTTETVKGAFRNQTYMNATDAQKLQSLNDALEILNSRYPERSIISEHYYQDLTCLRFRIEDYFEISIPVADSITLQNLIKEAQALANQLNEEIDSIDERGRTLVISIRYKYFDLIRKQLILYRLYASKIQIPDKDQLKLMIEQKINSTTSEIMARNLRISGGFKIDFSAGIFLTGLSVPEFVVRPHTFKYKETIQSVDTLSGNVNNIFTGNIRDTTGSLIYSKDPKFNYAAGFMSHAYVRTGKFANLGIATGLLVNDNGFQMLLGTSLLLHVRKSRIAFNGGVAIGKQKKISPVATRSVWSESLKDRLILNDISELPEFTTVTDVPYFERWRTSWYFGLTYNFNSAVIRF